MIDRHDVKDNIESWETGNNLKMFKGTGTTRDELDAEWEEYNSSMDPEQQKKCDDKSIELFGKTNLERYKEKIKQAEEKEAEEDIKESVSLNNIISSYSDILNSDDTDYRSDYSMEYNSDKFNSLLEYTPMIALNPIISTNKPMPIYLPREIETNLSLVPGEDVESINRFNDTFDNLFNGMKDDDFEDIRDEWFVFVATKQQAYFKIRSSDDDIDRLASNILEQEILAVGWNPDYDISSIDNWMEVNNQTLNRIKEEYYKNNSIVNLCELVDLIDAIPVNTKTKREKRPNMNPVYIVLVSGVRYTSHVIKWWTKGPFSHSALGLSHDLKNLVSFNNSGVEHKGLSIESVDMYVPDQRLAVYTIFINDEDYIALKKNIEYYVNNIDKTHYSKLNILTLAMNKPLNFQYDMICSQFVDRLLKFINIDIAGKDSSLVSPNDFFKAAATNTRIYKLYDGKVENYKPEKVKNAVDRLLYSKNTKYFKEFASLLEVGARLIKHRKTNIKQSYNTVYGKNVSNDGLALASDDYHKVVQQHSIELTEPMMKEFNRLSSIKDDEEFIEEFNIWMNREIDRIYPFVSVSNRQELELLRSALGNYAKEYNDESGVSYALSMQTTRYELEQEYDDITDDEIKEILKENYFIKSDDPERVRKELKLRLAYNKKIMHMFNMMIKYNYEQLGIAKEEADRIANMFKSQDSDKYEAVAIIKNALDENTDKFEVKPNVYDLRKLNLGLGKKAGVICISSNTPNDKMTILSRMIQKSLEWDCIVYSHGNTNPNIEDINKYRTDLNTDLKKALEEDHKNEFFEYFQSSIFMNFGSANENYKVYAEAIEDSLHNFFDFNYDKHGCILSISDDRSDISSDLLDKLIKEKPTTVKQIEDMLAADLEESVKKLTKYIYTDSIGTTEAPDKCFEEVMKYVEHEFFKDTLIPMCQLKALDEYLCNHTDWVWTIQPTYTPKSGPFKTMNELVRELIHEGFKKILIFSCNPGGYEFPDDIKNSRVLIKYGDASVVMENSEELDGYITEAELQLKMFCIGADIDYTDDAYLSECFNNLDKNILALSEASKNNNTTWEDLKQIMKDIIAGQTHMFKQTIAFFKSISDKIKSVFKNITNKDRFIKPVKARFISINKSTGTAYINKADVYNYDDLRKVVIKSCESVVDFINIYNKKIIRVNISCNKVIIKNSKSPKMLKESDSIITKQDIANDIFDNIVPVPINEVKEFPVQFDKDGNLLIKNYKKMDFNKEYQHSHSLLKTYDKSNSIEGMKYELARLWFVYTVLEATIYANDKLDDVEKSEYNKIKAWIMNDFTKYNKIVSSLDKSFNFSEYYNTTPFSDVYIKINASTLKFLKHLMSTLL